MTAERGGSNIAEMKREATMEVPMPHQQNATADSALVQRSGDRDSVEEIPTAGHHLLTLINELLNLSKTDSDNMLMSQALMDEGLP